MRYTPQYIKYKFSEPALKVINNALENNNILTEKAKVFDYVEDVKKQGITNDLRKATVGWIADNDLNQMLYDVCNYVNKSVNWNLDIKYLEPVQYGIYDIGDYFEWHNDQGNVLVADNLVRKVSMSLFLNDPDEYEGGELDIDYRNPNCDPRYDSFKLDRGYGIFFESDLWHRVRPIRSGVRKSLVAWFCGPRYV
tara:strand:- start:38 stop:622 length:585 start_codon:yes stop_codon:yes gene_type:complete